MGRFGQFLVSEGKLRPEQLKKAVDMQQMVGGRLGTNVLELGLMREETLLEALGRFRKTRTASAFQLRYVPAQTRRLVPTKIAQRYLILPIERRGNSLVLASMEPGDPLLEDELAALTSCLVRTVIGLEVRIHEALVRFYKVPPAPRLIGLARRLGGAANGRPATGPSPRERPTASSDRPALAPPAKLRTSPPPSAVAKRRTAGPSPPAATARGTESQAAPPEIEIEYIELDDDTRAQLFADDDHEAPLGSPQERLEAAARELQKIDIRDEIGDVVLHYCAPYLDRRLLLIRRKGQIVGWRGEGEGVEAEQVRAIDIPTAEPSAFTTLLEGTPFWLGSLSFQPAHLKLIDGLGGVPPRDCLLLPIGVRSRVVCFLYGDNRDQGVSQVPLPELRRLAAKAGVAFEVYILKNKIRTL